MSTRITEQFLNTHHNPSLLRKLSSLEVDLTVDDAALDNIVATKESLDKSAAGSAPQDLKTNNSPGTDGDSKDKGREPVASRSGCGCVIS